MDSVLRPLELTVPQYTCLELLGQRTGLSNADLARGAFVTRQSMKLVLRTFQDRELVTRPEVVDYGRARPAELTPAARRLLRSASLAVRDTEKRMLAPLSAVRCPAGAACSPISPPGGNHAGAQNGGDVDAARRSSLARPGLCCRRRRS
jgi:DNA-binding MarR family transcriptional regulator